LVKNRRIRIVPAIAERKIRRSPLAASPGRSIEIRAVAAPRRQNVVTSL
jgi:hypothetical protein